MIIVTGATGELGRRIVERLLTRVPAHQVGVSVRDPEKAKALADRGVRVRRGSFTDPDSLAHAFEDASQVLIVSVDKMGDEVLKQHRVAIDAAVAASARRILYTSQMGASGSSRFQACRDHVATEEALAACGVPYTSLRNGFYATSALHFLGHALETGSVALPADGPASWTAHADLAEAAAVILADEGRFDGPTPPLTGAQALSFADITSIATDLRDGPSPGPSSPTTSSGSSSRPAAFPPRRPVSCSASSPQAGRANSPRSTRRWPPCSAASQSPSAACCGNGCPPADSRPG
jgi:uncharacterized protein YbjT (DUF2867 family)